jgi:putative redox protein
MRAIARPRGGLTQCVEIGPHRVVVDEPMDLGGADEGPAPPDLLAASLASCTAITIAMYGARHDWDLGGIEVEVDGETGVDGHPTRLRVVLRLAAGTSDEQAERIERLARKCTVHRVLAGEVEIDQAVVRAS